MRTRGFEIAKGYEESQPNLPYRSTTLAAGYDFESIETVTLKPSEIKLVATGIKAYMQGDEYLGLYVRSSIPLKKGLIKANSTGIVDSDYYNNPSNDGHIMFQLMNVSSHNVTIEKGERIGQGIFQKFLLTDSDQAGGERNSGFGSTGR